MKIGEILRQQQSDVYKRLNSKRDDKEREQAKKQSNKQEHLSFYDVEKLMQEGCHAYKRAKGGAYRQIK